MELRVLGPMEAVDGGGAAIDLGPRLQRGVLGVLVMEAGRVVSADRLIDCLWGDDPPPTATKALQIYVSRLRKVLEPHRSPGAPSQVVLTQPPGYLLRVPEGTIDAVRFEALAAEAKASLAAGRAVEACVTLETALGLWRGAAYEDLAFEAFVEPEVRRLDELRAGAAEAWVEALLAANREAEAVVHAEALVAEDSVRERRWGLLALALYRAGRQGEALRTLDRARRTLGEELGIERGPELRRLEQDIFAQAPALELPAPGEPQSRTQRQVSNRLASILAIQPPRTPQAHGGGVVLAPDARPLGYSLADMAAAFVPFTVTGYDPALRPDTPFQPLHIEGFEFRKVGTGLLGTATRTFSATPTTHFYVPLFLEVDGPVATVAPFPVTADQAVPFFFDPTRLGARDFEIIVDGLSTPIGPEYVVGPHACTHDAGRHYVILGAFIGRLTPGTHTVVVRGGCFGAAMFEAYRVAFIQEDLGYTVEVTEGN